MAPLKTTPRDRSGDIIGCRPASLRSKMARRRWPSTTPGQHAGHALDRLQRRGRVLRPDYAGDPAHSLADCFVRPPSHRDLRGHRLGITQSRCRMIEYQRSFRPRKTKWELNQGCPAPPRLTKIRYTKLRASCAFAHTTSPRRLSLVVVVSTIWRLTPPK